MEKILKEILAELKDLKGEVKDLKSEVKDHGRRLDNIENCIKDHGRRLENLEIAVNGIREEHGQMLRAILESKEIQRGEIDKLTHRTAKIEGTLKGAATQVLEDLKEVSNQ
ncbi:hypothetical protein [Thermincola potens]|uniref:Uncharacterized protein n=1 Tax=Thermincola potens (strain JR) TaxID=635013 RepID=D5XD29_THEPJ|nr:hypothetical protein [Thermincola potens]ADG83705.1 hypothetical protein TherJR_2873 [Thermincola potens JR]